MKRSPINIIPGFKSLYLPANNFINSKLTNPMPIPSAIEKVNGIDITVKRAGITSVISPQSINFIPENINIETNKSAPAVA